MDKNIDRLCDLIRNHEIVLWAGSGLSLYAGYPAGRNLCKIILDHAEKEEHKKILQPHINSLMTMSTEFEQLYSREKLDEILELIFNCPPSVDICTHKLIAKIPQIDSIITTNYDKLFEIAFGSKLNVFKGTAFQKDIPGKVNLYKIHGDFEEKNSIVLTSKDYATFYERLDTLLWNKLKPILAVKSVLFIGYSLEDKNIEDIFDKVLQQVKPSSEFFIVMPSLPEHKINHFNTICKTTFIPMTGEELVQILEKKIREYIVLDAVAKKIDIDHAYSVCHDYGIDVSFSHKPDGATTKVLVDGYKFGPLGQCIGRSFSAKSNEDNTEEFKRFIEDCDCKEIEIPACDTELYRNIQGINLPDMIEIKGQKPTFAKFVKQDDIYYPEIADLNGETLLEKVTLKIERGNVKSRVSITASATIVVIEKDNSEVKMSIRFIYPHVSKYAIQELCIYQRWINGCILLFRTKRAGHIEVVYKLNDISNEENVDNLKTFLAETLKRYRNIQLIEKDMSKKYVIEKEFSDRESFDITKAAASVEPQIVKWTGAIDLVTKIDISKIRQFQQDYEINISTEEKELSTKGIVELFGDNFLLGREKITIMNPVISNLSEFIEALQNGNNIPLKIISKTNEAKLKYIWNEADQKEHELFHSKN